MPRLNIPSGQALASSSRWNHDNVDNITKKAKMIKSDPDNDYDQPTAWWGVKSAKDCHKDEEEGSTSSSFVDQIWILILDVNCFKVFKTLVWPISGFEGRWWNRIHYVEEQEL